MALQYVLNIVRQKRQEIVSRCLFDGIHRYPVIAPTADNHSFVRHIDRNDTRVLLYAAQIVPTFGQNDDDLPAARRDSYLAVNSSFIPVTARRNIGFISLSDKILDITFERF